MLYITHCRRTRTIQIMQTNGEHLKTDRCEMDVESEPASLERSPGSSTDEIPVKQDNRPSIEGHTQSRKRPFRDISTGFTKAVIICNSSELTKSEASTYRPNNIVIELLKKNQMRYGKFTFQKFTSEKEIRVQLSLRFTILKNKKFWFASADQYGKLNFRELEEWSGRNMRRWLPGSSAMYIILENSRTGNEGEAKDNTPYSGISCTTVRAGTSTTSPVSWHANNSQRALLDFLSSSEKSKLCNTQKLKMFAISASAGQQESKASQNQSSKSPARIDLHSFALHTKNERIDVDLESRFSRKPSLETTLSPKRRRTFHTSQSVPCFTRLTTNDKPFLADKNLELEHQILEKKKEKEISDVAQSSHENKKLVSRTLYENSPEKPHTKLSSKEPFISKGNNCGPIESSNGCLESREQKKDSTPSSPQESAQRIPNYPDGSRIPRFFNPYYLMPDPRVVFGCRPTSEEQIEMKAKASSGHEVSSCPSSTPVSPVQAIYVPSTGFFPWGQINQGGQMHLPDKGHSVAFVPFEVLPYSNNGRLYPYGFTTTNTNRNEASRHDVPELNKIDQRNNQETNVREEKEEKEISEKRPKDPLVACSEVTMETSLTDPLVACSEVSVETQIFETNNTKKRKDKDLVQKFLDICGMEEKMKEGKDLKYGCAMFPSSGPCEGGQSFVVVLNQPLEEQFNQASFCAKFSETSWVRLTRVDNSTLKGRAVPESSGSGHASVRVEADGHVIGCTSFMYEDGFFDGLRKVMFSDEHGEMMLRFMTASENERLKLQAELTNWLELVVYLSAQNGSTTTIDKIFSSRYSDAVKAQFSKRPIQPHQLALRNRRAELTGYPNNMYIRNDIDNNEPNKVKKEVGHIQFAANNDFDEEVISSSPSDSNESAHAQDCDESRDNAPEDKDRNTDLDDSPDYENGKADNLMLLSSIAIRMGTDAPNHDDSKNSSLNSSPSRQLSNGSMSAAATTSSREDESRQEPGCPRSGFLKKVFVLPPNSLYLPSQSELCKFRGSRSSYCKVFFSAEMNENDVYEQIRMAFADLVGFSFRLAVVDQTGKLVFYDGYWTGKVIRRKLRGNSVLYVVPVVESGEDHRD